MQALPLTEPRIPQEPGATRGETWRGDGEAGRSIIHNTVHHFGSEENSQLYLQLEVVDLPLHVPLCH